MSKASTTGGGDRSSSTAQKGAAIPDRRCNHPLAVLIDPTDRDLRALEAMLARCPNCSRWAPGDGPIMATLPGRRSAGNHDGKDTV